MMRAPDRPLRVAFRADSSRDIGHGHVMRCLSLADVLRDVGMEARFVCRDVPGNLIDTIRVRGHDTVALPSHVAGWEADAAHTQAALADWDARWLVVDHYGLDARWESRLAESADRIAVIDDLADRDHACALLLDQTLGRNAADYTARVPANCRVLTGSTFALLHPAFATMREASLARRHDAVLRDLLVSVGGVDAHDAAGRVLDALAHAPLPVDTSISVAVTHAAPHINALRMRAARMPTPTHILVDVPDMPALLARMDLVIGAGGTSSWERCCLGVPSIALVLVDNQRDVAHALDAAGAALAINDLATLEACLLDALRHFSAPAVLAKMSAAASRVTDGLGAARVAAAMEACHA